MREAKERLCGVEASGWADRGQLWVVCTCSSAHSDGRYGFLWLCLDFSGVPSRHSPDFTSPFPVWVGWGGMAWPAFGSCLLGL